jgi:hypothetical protein
VSPLEHLPELTGPHELSWSYILDHIFADAFHARLAHLEVNLPAKSLEAAVRLRANLTPNKAGEKGNGFAALGVTISETPDVKRFYTLRFGSVAPISLRRTKPYTSSAKLLSHLSIFTLQASLWGIPIRLGSMLNRPDLHDRAIYAMRRAFTSETSTPAYYHLSSWENK